MRLYHSPLSGASRATLMAAIHTGQPLDLVDVDLRSQDDRLRLAALNPNVKIPVLEDGDVVLWESLAIMQYLCDRQGGHAAYPQGAAARADVNRWLFWCASHWSSTIGVFVFENVIRAMAGLGAPDSAVLGRAERDMARFATVLDRHLEGRDWVSGGGVTLADLALAAPLMYRDAANLPLAPYKHIQNWFERVKNLDCWVKTEKKW